VAQGIDPGFSQAKIGLGPIAITPQCSSADGEWPKTVVANSEKECGQS
jgi:hypothetical protein